jgi:hypothetical protein
MVTKIKNLTPHDIVLFGDNGWGMTFYADPTTPTARVRATSAKAVPGIMVNENEIPSFYTLYGETENLPPQEARVWLIVSTIVRQANPLRKDLISPDTGSTACRDEGGEIVGVRGFIRN